MRFGEHVIADLVLLGKSFPWIHRYMDAPVKILGAGHRIVSHSEELLKTLKFFEEIWGKDAVRVALFHILVDSGIYEKKLIGEVVSRYRLVRWRVVEKKQKSRRK